MPAGSTCTSTAAARAVVLLAAQLRENSGSMACWGSLLLGDACAAHSYKAACRLVQRAVAALWQPGEGSALLLLLCMLSKRRRHQPADLAGDLAAAAAVGAGGAHIALRRADDDSCGARQAVGG